MEKNIPFQHKLCTDVSFTGNYQMPKLKAYNGNIPSDIIAFHRAKYHGGNQSLFIHFFLPDEKFRKAIAAPETYLGVFRKFGGIISPDASVYVDMPLPYVMSNSFTNKLIGAWLQKQGIPVIPNVSWSRKWSYDFCFEGFPKNSIIAVNSTGIGNDSRAKAEWIAGYRQMLKVLQPTLILRYGAKQEGERDSISIYYENDNYKAINYGR